MAENSTIISVGLTEEDGYGNLWVTPQGGGDKIKIGVKRKNLHPLFEQGKSVMLEWQTYNKIPYVSNAKLVEGALPEGKTEKPIKVSDSEKASAETQKTRAVALSYSKDLACAKIIGVEDMRRWADKFIEYMKE